MYFGFQAVVDAQTTWAAPTNEKQKALFYDSGAKPYSVKIGDNWVPFAYLGPFGLALAVPAANKYYSEQSPKALTDTELDKIKKIIGDTAGYITSQTSVPSLMEFIQVVSGQSNKKLEDVAGFSASQFIPASGMLRFASQIFDPIYRQADGFIENIQRGTPFKAQLRPYLNEEGRESKRNIFEFVTPHGLGKSKPEVEQKLERLQEIARLKNVPAWYKTQLRQVQENIQNINRNKDMSDEEKEKRLKIEEKRIDLLNKRFEEIKGKEVKPQQKSAEPTPAVVRPTLRPQQPTGFTF